MGRYSLDGPPNKGRYSLSSPEQLKATDEDKTEAFNQIKKQFPGMPDLLIKGLLPIATKMAETPADNSPGTATGAFLRSAVRAPLEGAENLASLVGLPTVKNAEFPGAIAESESDKEHPFAEFGGALTGFLAPGAGSVAALRSIPAWERIIANSSPSILKKLLTRGAEGSALGAGFSPEGDRGKGALIGGAIGGAASLLPILTRFPATRKLNKVRQNLQEKGVSHLNIPDYIINDIESNNYLRNTKANRNLLDRAKTGNYQDLFDLQSDMGGLQRRYSNDVFSSAQRELGRDIGKSRQDLLHETRKDIEAKGHKEDADLMRLGQEQYRQYSKLKPYRNGALIAMLAGLPGYKYLKKLIS